MNTRSDQPIKDAIRTEIMRAYEQVARVDGHIQEMDVMPYSQYN